MKKLIIFFLGLFLIAACADNDTDEVEEFGEENGIYDNEAMEYDYGLTEGQAGPYRVGSHMPMAGHRDEYGHNVRQGKKTYNAEGEEYEETFIIIEDSTGALMALVPKDSLIGEIVISSEKFKTDSGISRGSSLSEIMQKYPDSEIWYSAVKNNFWAETDSLKGVRFGFNESAYQGDRNQLKGGDTIKVEPAQLADTAKVVEIRIVETTP